MSREFPPRIEEPCPKNWADMAGDARRRYCSHCELHVHNLSEMSAPARDRLLSSETPLCVTYVVNSAGHLVSNLPPRSFRAVLRRLRMALMTAAAAAIPLGLSSCMYRLTGAIPPSDKTVKASEECDNPRPVLPGRIGIPPAKPQGDPTR